MDEERFSKAKELRDQLRSLNEGPLKM